MENVVTPEGGAESDQLVPPFRDDEEAMWPPSSPSATHVAELPKHLERRKPRYFAIGDGSLSLPFGDVAPTGNGEFPAPEESKECDGHTAEVANGDSRTMRNAPPPPLPQPESPTRLLGNVTVSTLRLRLKEQSPGVTTVLAGGAAGATRLGSRPARTSHTPSAHEAHHARPRRDSCTSDVRKERCAGRAEEAWVHLRLPIEDVEPDAVDGARPSRRPAHLRPPPVHAPC